MDKKLKLPQTIIATILCIIMLTVVYYISGLSILIPIVSGLFVVIASLSDNKGRFVSCTISVILLSLVANVGIMFNYMLNCIIPSIVMGIVLDKSLKSNGNKYESIFAGTIAFILGLMANYVIAKNLFNIDILEEFTTMLKEDIASQKEILEQVTGEAALDEEYMIQNILNIMPVILFCRGIISAILNYFIAIIMLKRVRKNEIEGIKFSKFYLPGNAVMISFIGYVFILLLEFMKAPLYTDLILMNLQAIFYILFFVQGIAVMIFYISRWLKNKSFFKFIMAFVSMVLFGIFGVSLIGMIDCVFDFRKVKIAN